MKCQSSKNVLLATVFCALLVGSFVLVGCAGKGSLSSDIEDETGAYMVKADDAGKGSMVMASGGFVVKEGQIVVVSPAIKKGNLQVKLMNASNEAVLDEKVTGSVLSTFEIAPGDYAISVTCNEDGTTGELIVVAVDAAEFEKQNQDLDAALAAAKAKDASASASASASA